MGLLTGKRILVTGVLTAESMAFGIASAAAAEGADLVLTGAGRGLSLTKRTARKLPGSPPVLAFDVTDAGHPAALRSELADRWGSVDGAVHSFETFEHSWAARAPLGWDVKDSSSVAKAAVALLSDWFPMTTGEMIHVDGGYHAVGA